MGAVKGKRDQDGKYFINKKGVQGLFLPLV